MPLEHQKAAGKGQGLDRWSNGDWRRRSLALCQAVEWGGQITERSWRGSEEDNPQAARKAAAVGVRAWHCKGLLLLGSGDQQSSATPESCMKWGADRLVSVPGDAVGHQLKVEEPGGVQSPGQSLSWPGVGL